MFNILTAKIKAVLNNIFKEKLYYHLTTLIIYDFGISHIPFNKHYVIISITEKIIE